MLSQSNPFLICWTWIYLAMCISSSYIYAYMAAFHLDSKASLLSLSIIFECIAAVTMVLRFITEFTPEGSPTPTRDLAQIALRYLKT